MDSLFSISPPEHFDYNDVGCWPYWIRRYERSRIAVGISERSQEYQVNSLIHTMGDEADNIMCMLDLSEEDRKKYDNVKEAFEKHNKHHRTQTKPALQTGQSGWIKIVPNPGRLTSPADTPLSYIVDGQTGSLRRHRSHLRAVPSRDSGLC